MPHVLNVINAKISGMVRSLRNMNAHAPEVASIVDASELNRIRVCAISCLFYRSIQEFATQINQSDSQRRQHAIRVCV